MTIDLSGAHWVKSKHSNNGGICVEVALDFPAVALNRDSTDLAGARWVKSTRSNNGGECVEVAPDFHAVVPIRDSKDPHGPALVFGAEAFAAFVAGIKAGEFGAV
ncbi:hypothetical protein P3T36_004792 [Kitasatospora sp. MAP12-15]|uniref:DUF397 domain-containing protein n=1 Tax=unclassified Kitasatospora TaxID=2633591 RepID=UPI002475FDBA|nr:DUF397 domain-containing protein [Kitasatospora sp. MAP12-44]MDH6110276.1 hypothetical protein [Kitasatospora sp. MAP12-44]